MFKVSLAVDNTPIGICGFVQRDYLEFPDIGFAILPQFEGKGYTYEASLALMEFGKNELKFKTILGITDEENLASQHLLLKLGLKRVKTFFPPNSDNELILFEN